MIMNFIEIIIYIFRNIIISNGWFYLLTFFFNHVQNRIIPITEDLIYFQFRKDYIFYQLSKCFLIFSIKNQGEQLVDYLLFSL